MLPAPPQFSNQVPPGAQQLTLPDLLKMPHCGHAIVSGFTEPIAGVPTGAVIDVLATRSRSANGRRKFAYSVGGQSLHSTDPDEPSKMSTLLAVEYIHTLPQSFRVKDIALGVDLDRLPFESTLFFPEAHCGMTVAAEVLMHLSGRESLIQQASPSSLGPGP